VGHPDKIAADEFGSAGHCPKIEIIKPLLAKSPV
jgi:hypothetical protein